MLTLVGVAVETLSSSSAHAQRRQTLGECIAELRNQGFYGNDAADRCQRLLESQNQSPIDGSNLDTADLEVVILKQFPIA